jgi:hypothetical protein
MYDKFYVVKKKLIRFGTFCSNKIESLVFLLLFIIIFVPIGILLRIFQKDLLFIKSDHNTASYWKENETFIIKNMKYQF